MPDRERKCDASESYGVCEKSVDELRDLWDWDGGVGPDLWSEMCDEIGRLREELSDARMKNNRQGDVE